MDGSGITPVMNVGAGCGYGDYGFGGNGLWLFAILALMNGGFGWGNRGFGYGFGEGRFATVEDLANQSNFTRLEGQVRANENLIQQGITNLGNGICSLGYQLATDKGEISKQISDCCCTTQRAVDSVKFDMANYAAAINANTTAQAQKIVDVLRQDKIEALQGRVNLLEMQNLVQPPRAVPAYPACNPYLGAYGIGTCGSCSTAF